MSRYQRTHCWIPIKNKPPEGEAIDIWHEFRDENTGEVRGRRITNCWYYGNNFLHGALGRLYCVTHWRKEPDAPKVSGLPQKKP